MWHEASVWLKRGDNLGVPESWLCVTARCKQTTEAWRGSRLLRTSRKTSWGLYQDSCLPGAAEPGPGHLKQVPEELVKAACRGHVYKCRGCKFGGEQQRQRR